MTSCSISGCQVEHPEAKRYPLMWPSCMVNKDRSHEESAADAALEFTKITLLLNIYLFETQTPNILLLVLISIPFGGGFLILFFAIFCYCAPWAKISPHIQKRHKICAHLVPNESDHGPRWHHSNRNRHKKTINRKNKKTRVVESQTKMSEFYGMVTGPTALHPFCGKDRNLVIFTSYRHMGKKSVCSRDV